MATNIRFAVPNQTPSTNPNLVVADTTGYAVYDPVTTGVAVAQANVPVTPGVPVVEGNGIETGLNRSEQVTVLPGTPMNIGTST